MLSHSLYARCTEPNFFRGHAFSAGSDSPRIIFAFWWALQ